MFRFAELLIILGIVYIILNLLWYIVCKFSGVRSVEKVMFFGMANKWLDDDEQKAKKSDDEPLSQKRRTR